MWIHSFNFNELHKKNKVIGVFLDTAKAFDTIYIPILVKKKLEIKDTTLLSL